MKKDPKVYLLDIKQAIEDIASYAKHKTKADFIEDRLLQDGIIRKVSVIGEAAKRLPPALKNQERAIPWKRITGMRDIVVHDYSDIDLNKVWEVVKYRLPELDAAFGRLLTNS